MGKLISTKPKQVIKNNSKYLKQVRIRFGNAKGEMRENNAFNLIRKVKGILG